MSHIPSLLVVVVVVTLSVVGVLSATEYPTAVTLNIACTELAVTATFNKEEFTGGNVTQITWNDPQCGGFDDTGTQVSATTQFARCKSVVKQTDDLIVQENTAHVLVTYYVDIVQRDIIYDFLLRCSMQRNIHTPVGAHYNVTEKRFLGKINRTSQADFNIRMDIYKNGDFAQVLNNPTVTSFDPIYISIREVNDNKLLKFIVQQCFATPSSERGVDVVSYTFFYNKCQVDDSFELIKPSSEHHYNFKVAAFKFIRLSKSVYIHCRLALCKTNATTPSCTQENPDCNRRRKRAISVGDENEKPLEEITVMTSRLTFVERTCAQLTCPTFSQCVDLDPPVCRCGSSYVLDVRTNTCSRERTFVIYGLYFDLAFHEDFLDPYSKKFVALADRIEQQLHHLVKELGDDNIVGMKVVRARKGSVVVDVRVIYRESSTENEAYATFLKAVSPEHASSVNYDDKLTIKSEKPTLDGVVSAKPVTLVVVLSVIVPLVIVISVGGAVYYNRRRLWGKKTVEA